MQRSNLLERFKLRAAVLKALAKSTNVKCSNNTYEINHFINEVQRNLSSFKKIVR